MDTRHQQTSKGYTFNGITNGPPVPQKDMTFDGVTAGFPAAHRTESLFNGITTGPLGTRKMAPVPLVGGISTEPIAQQEEQQEWSKTYLPQEADTREKGFFAWWYRLSAPPTPPANASLREREIARRGRLTSLVLFFMVLLLAAGIPAQIFQNPQAAVPLIGLSLPILLSIWLNRRKNINVAGAIVVVLLVGGLSLVLTFLQPGGMLSSNSISFYDLMIEGELFAVSLLPAEAVFIVAAYNCIFVVMNYNLLPHTADLNTVAAIAGADVLVRPIGLFIMVALITYLWVRSATRAIQRADRAEQIALLEHALAKQTQTVADQKRQLDTSIHYIVQTHMQVANGDLSARVPLTQDNILWEIAGTLNNLLSRFQHARLAEQKLEELQSQLQWAHQARYEVARLREEHQQLLEELQANIELIHRAKTERSPLSLTTNHPVLVPLLAELNGNYVLANRHKPVKDTPTLF
jgi:hypothetical protein